MNAIDALDLEPIKVKLMHKQSGEGWTLDRANAVEFEYRRFLHLMKKYPAEPTSPLVDVDTFWHYHILDTMKYAADCDAVFGYFLHHFPYIGMRGAEDEATLARIGQRMRQLYEAEFGDDYVRAARAARGADGATAQAACGGNNVAYCGIPVEQAAAPASAAYCGSPGAVAASLTAAVYRGAPPARNADAVAYCGIPDQTELSSAYCGIPPAQAANTVAYCGAPAERAADGAAYCGMPPGQGGLAQATRDALYTVRPRLS